MSHTHWLLTCLFLFPFYSVFSANDRATESIFRAFIVNHLNGSGSVRYIDFSLNQSSVPLELVRTYNSITALNENTGWLGAFGWGWTTPFETTLIATPTGEILLRDGGTGNTVIFRPQKEDPKLFETFLTNLKNEAMKRSGKKLSDEEIAKIKTDPKFRTEIARRFNITGVPTTGLLLSTEYGYQTLQFKNNQWLRERDGMFQVFDQQGRLIQQVERGGSPFTFKYPNATSTHLSEISDALKGESLKFKWQGDRIVEVVDNKGTKATYRYDANNNLVGSNDSSGKFYFFKYENPKFTHLITKIEYPSAKPFETASSREIQYDNNGLVVYIKDRDGVETRYLYGRGEGDPDNNFWTKTVTKIKNISSEQYEEFFVKNRTDGSRYLYKQDLRKGGQVTSTIFTPCCAKPLQITKEGKTTYYKYDEAGLLKEKSGPGEELKMSYDPVWKKVSKVSINGMESNFEYDNRGNLVTASNNKGEKISLKYDKKTGRISKATDPDGKELSFEYNEQGRFGSITQKGLGSVKIDYNSEGTIERLTPIQSSIAGRRPTQSAEQVKQIMGGFQRFLDILRPLGAQFSSF